MNWKLNFDSWIGKIDFFVSNGFGQGIFLDWELGFDSLI
jgi:hypothetical protein